MCEIVYLHCTTCTNMQLDAAKTQHCAIPDDAPRGVHRTLRQGQCPFGVGSTTNIKGLCRECEKELKKKNSLRQRLKQRLSLGRKDDRNNEYVDRDSDWECKFWPPAGLESGWDEEFENA
ncbi:hypothetical protein Dda_6827 [Drechslerella dactyloides]|uniref:Uncharacterized protein n=1 Tax=Drechslerella dactyloides TaxID=74499 RepID=A0AAD6NHR9_DREDA|nr:hypothetical protein Dda_6827 [Drechslerella dactyloides]